MIVKKFFHPEKKEKEEEKLMRDLVKFITFFSLLPATHTVSRRERAAKRMEKSFLRFVIASVWPVHSSVFPKKLLSYQTLHHLRCCWAEIERCVFSHSLPPLSRSAATFFLGMSYRFLSGATECEKKHRVRKSRTRKWDRSRSGRMNCERLKHMLSRAQQFTDCVACL